MPNSNIFEMNAGIIPCLNYRDATVAIKWLCDAFDFNEKSVHKSEEGKVVHAELTYKGSMIMVGSSDSGTTFSRLIKQPQEVEGFETQSPYVVINHDEIDHHYENAKKLGAKILMELEEQEYGGKNYTCYDIEGHLWSFGSYDPWAY